MARKEIPEVRTFIEQLGGGTEVAAALNKLLPAGEKTVDREAVYKWCINGIPHSKRLYMAALGQKAEVKLPSSLIPYVGGALTTQPLLASNASNASSKKSSASLRAPKKSEAAA